MRLSRANRSSLVDIRDAICTISVLSTCFISFEKEAISEVWAETSFLYVIYIIQHIKYHNNNIAKVQRTIVQHVNVLTLFISMVPKNKETSGQIRRTKFKIPFQSPNLSKSASSCFLLQRYYKDTHSMFVN